MNPSFGEAFFLLWADFVVTLLVADASLVSVCRMCRLYTVWCVDSVFTAVLIGVDGVPNLGQMMLSFRHVS